MEISRYSNHMSQSNHFNGSLSNPGNTSRDKIICGVCRQKYRLPRILPCLHTFCSECISSLETYPTNDEEDSSGDTDHTADWLLSNGIGNSYEELVGKEVEIYRPQAGIENSDNAETSKHKFHPRGRSRHARLIEKRIQRSQSCHDNSLETNSVETEMEVERRSSSKKSLRRSSSSYGSKLNMKTLTLSLPRSSVYFCDYDGDGSVCNINKSCDKSKTRIVLCPKCLKEVRISTHLDELPRNFIIERLVAHDTLLSSSCHLTCDSCGDDETDTENFSNDEDKRESKIVTVRCVECQENLCSPCEHSHRRQKKTKRHQLILLKDYIDSNSGSSNSSSMSTIPESIKEDTTHSENPQISERPRLLKTITKLKLPNLHQFNQLLLNEDNEKRNSLENKNFDFKNGKAGEVRWAVPNGQGSENGPEPPKIASENTKNKKSSRNRSMEMAVSSRKKKLDTTRPMFCLKHPDEKLKLFCVTCEENVCRDCVVFLHRDHVCQMLTKELFQSQMADVDKLIKTVIPKVEVVDDQLESIAELKVKVKKKSQRVKDEINTFMDSYVEAIEKHRQQLLSQVTSLVDSKERSLGVSQLHLEHMRSDVEQTCHFVAELQMEASDVEILSMKKLVTQRLTTLQRVGCDPEVNLNVFLRFCPTERGEVINNFQMFGRVVARQPCAFKCFLNEDGFITARISHKCTTVLTVCDTDGLPYYGNDVSIRAWLIFQEQRIRTVPVSLVHLKDGTYQLEFTPLYKGLHLLHVAVNGQPVKNSPFKLQVKTRWRRHKGVWQCCTFCSTQGLKDVTCACGGIMEGGYLGCGHGHQGHPGGHHWSCCGKMSRDSECLAGSPRTSPLRQITL